MSELASEGPRTQAREGIREYVRFNAAHPELFRFMVEQGKCDDERMRWLVDTHLKPIYDGIPSFGAAAEGPLKAHAYYVLAGAGSVLFAVAPECRRLTGFDPMQDAAVEAHADFVARILVP
jgi:hypothetical protein